MRPRSGLAVKYGLTLPNAPATIDSDYRGELMIPMINLGTEPVAVTRGMRIAQLVFQRIEQIELVEVQGLPVNRQRVMNRGIHSKLAQSLLNLVPVALDQDGVLVIDVPVPLPFKWQRYPGEAGQSTG